MVGQAISGRNFHPERKNTNKFTTSAFGFTSFKNIYLGGLFCNTAIVYSTPLPIV